MQLFNKNYYPLPENGGDFDPKGQEREKPVDADSLLSGNKTEDKDSIKPADSEHKSLKATLRDALQEWSNDDARDIEEDDSTPLRSGL